jgi:hypothetical protein
MDQPTTGTCAKCHQPRPLFSFSFVPFGWAEFVERMLCARCWSVCTEAEENDEFLSFEDLIEYGTDEQVIAALTGAS